LLLAFCARAQDPTLEVRLTIDLGKDVGQNFGTLFEAKDADGKAVAGAGYLGAYNTQARSDRRLVHFYVKSDTVFTPEALPRVNKDAGMYLFEFDNRLFAKARGGMTDTKLRSWDADGGAWRVDEETVPLCVHVGGGVLASSARGVTYEGHSVLKVPERQGSLAERYYANGFLVFRRHDREATPPVNELVACAWTPNKGSPVNLAVGRTIAMRTPREFVYAYGQVDDQIVAATNTGGVYVFEDPAWRCILEPDVNVSFQIYAMINYRDRLLMGQYPTGELFEYDGATLRQMPGHPGVMPGVRKQAREAQTLTIYGGELYAGVWPWGEVWRFEDDAEWRFLGRMFTHPEPTTETTHPYETETTALDPTLNRWGQRVTGLVPLGDLLYISTSAKGPNPYEPKFTFLADGKWKEYGTIYRWRKPGALAVHTAWTSGPTTFEFIVRDREMEVRQDGQLLGSAECDPTPLLSIAPDATTWGDGIFGALRGTIVKRNLVAE
jgi:hypothetical protein